MPAHRLQAQELQTRVNELAENLDSIHSTTELLDAVMGLIAPVGYVATACGRFGEARAPQVLHFHNWHLDAFENYVRNQWMRIDPAPIWASRSGMAIAVGELRLAIGKNHPGNEVWDYAATVGYVGGYLVPLRAYDGTLGLMTFLGARDPQSIVERIALRSLAYIAFEHAEKLSGRAPPARIPMPPPPLSEREHLCLKYLVHGKSIPQIAKLMHVTEATVRFHSANLRRKVGASSRAELAAFANANSLVPRE